MRRRANLDQPLLAALVISTAAACGGDKPPTGPPVARVEVSPPYASVTAGETIRLDARAEDAGGNLVDGLESRWVSDAPEVANVDWRGEVAGLSPGAAIVTAIVDGKRGSARVKVEAPRPRVTSVSPDPGIEGQVATIMGQGLDPVASSNRGTVDGAPAVGGTTLPPQMRLWVVRLQ